MFTPKYIGLLSCSGEEFSSGTLSRIATRKVLAEMLNGVTTTICVPLFLAGDEQERNFVKKFPCITIDGCQLGCVERAVKAMGREPIACINLKQFFTADEYQEIENSPRHDLYWKDHPFTIKLATHIAEICVAYLEPEN